jgi:hypothetical protein
MLPCWRDMIWYDIWRLRSIHNLRTWHVVVTREPLNMILVCVWNKLQSPHQLKHFIFRVYKKKKT